MGPHSVLLLLAWPSLASSSCFPVPPPDVAHYRFEDPAGSRYLRDDSGSGAHLIPDQPSGYQHPFAEVHPGEGLGGGGAIRFYSRSGASATVKAFRTVAVWVQRDVGCCIRMDGMVTSRHLDGKKHLDMGYSNNYYWNIYAYNADTQANTNVYYKGDHILATTKEWVHWAGVMHEDKLVVYFNGVEIMSRNGDLSDAALGTGPFKFRMGRQTHWPFYGLMDEVRLYSAPLSAAEIALLASSATRDNGGLVAGEEVLRADVPPPLSIWRPAHTLQLQAACSGADGATAAWAVESGPGLTITASSVASGCSGSCPAVMSGRIGTPARGAPGKPFFADAASAATQVRFPPAASLGDYVLSLNCTSPCGTTRKETVVVAVFEAHETGRTGATVHTRPVGPFDCPNLGTPVTPKGLWRFDGDGSNDVPGGQAAEVEILVGTAQPDWGAEGKFGGGVDLRCVMAGDCHYLKFGNPETTPWSAICVSYWFWTVKELKNTWFRKGESFKDVGPGWFTYTTHEWHHYVFCQDEQIYKWYKDGVLERMEHGRGARTAADAADFMSIGLRGGHPSYGFNGTLDDLAVYDFILSNDEVEQIYTNGAASFTQRLCGDPYWHGGYSTGFIREWFPNLTDDTADYVGYFKADPHVTPPTPYVHPRLFFGPGDLNALRVKFRTVDAARTAYEALKSRLQISWYSAPLADIATRNLSFAELAASANSIQDFMLQAFRCLIDHDRVMAERLGEQLESLALEAIAKVEAFVPDYDEWKIQGSSYDTTDIWRIPQHDYVMRLALAFCYDFLYPLLATSTRELLRSALAKVTQGVWSVGMRAYGPSTSNWHSWVTGDLVLNLIAIYGEDGFDEGVYEAATESFRVWTQTGVSMTSGATYEGGGKNGLGGSKLMAMALHGQPQYLASQGALKFVRSFLLHMMLPNGHWFEDDLWGSIEAKPLIGDVAPFKHAYPNDKVIDYVYRMVVDGGHYATASVVYKGVDLPYREYTATRHSVYTYNNFIMDVIYAADFFGPSNITEHGMSMADQPLAYAATDRGLMVARSAWGDENAAWLLLNIRSQPGGHASPARGEFCFYALGQVWAFYHTGHNIESWKHSVVHVDGVGQLGHRGHEPPGIFLAYNDSQEATFASVDMIYPYTDAPWGLTTPNTFHLEPGPHKWQGLAYRLVPHWYQGVLATLDIVAAGKLGNFTRALRTAGLVRAVKPYALILDDFKKNDTALSYQWRMPLQPHSKVPNRQDGHVDSTCVTYSVGGAGLSIAVSGSDAVLPAVDGSSTRLLVRLLPGSSAGAVWSVTAETASCGGQYLLSTLTGTEARFRVLLYPLEAGEALPTTTWDAVTGVLSLTRAGTAGTDEITMAVSASGLTSAASVRLSA